MVGPCSNMNVLPARKLLATTRIKDDGQILEDVKDAECNLCAQILMVSLRTLKTGVGKCFEIKGIRTQIVQCPLKK